MQKAKSSAKSSAKRVLIGLLASLSLACCLSGCAQKPTIHLAADVGYVDVSTLPQGGNISSVRLKALRETATQLGARGALAWRSVHLNKTLSKRANELNQIFNFNQLMLPHHVVPPVLVESSNTLNLANSTTIRLASKTYRIIKPARFATTAPNWREYLWMNYKKPKVPNKTLLPHTRAEAKVWNHYLKIGWKEGLSQADAIFATSLNRLRRDYNGMILYRKLYAQHMVSAPYVAKADLGVTGNSNHLTIGDKILRITSPSALETNSDKWQAVITR